MKALFLHPMTAIIKESCKKWIQDSLSKKQRPLMKYNEHKLTNNK